jgi:PAS domain S-box-containing protein
VPAQILNLCLVSNLLISYYEWSRVLNCMKVNEQENILLEDVECLRRQLGDFIGSTVELPVPGGNGGREWPALARELTDIVMTVSPEGSLLGINRTVPPLTFEEVVGTSIYDHIVPEDRDKVRNCINGVCETGRIDAYRVNGTGPEGPASSFYETRCIPMNRDSRIEGVVMICRDVTDYRKARRDLENCRAELTEHRTSLREKDAAIREVLSQIEEHRLSVKKQISVNVDNLIMPVVERIRRSVNPQNMQDVELLEANLRDLCSEFGLQLTSGTAALTPRELEISNMIRSGMTSKDVAGILGISLRTVETHRNNIRKKIGISGTDSNLTTFLRLANASLSDEA